MNDRKKVNQLANMLRPVEVERELAQGAPQGGSNPDLDAGVALLIRWVRQGETPPDAASRFEMEAALAHFGVEDIAIYGIAPLVVRRLLRSLIAYNLPASTEGLDTEPIESEGVPQAEAQTQEPQEPEWDEIWQVEDAQTVEADPEHPTLEAEIIPPKDETGHG